MTWVQSQYPCHRRRWQTSTSLMSVCFLWHTHVCLPPPHCQNTYLQINNKCNQKYFLSLLQEEENRQRLRVTFKLCYIIHTFIACLLFSSAELACFLGLSKEIAIIFDAWINRNISFHIPRGQRSKVKAWTGPLIAVSALLSPFFSFVFMWSCGLPPRFSLHLRLPLLSLIGCMLLNPP